jgi:hypothetical protein
MHRFQRKERWGRATKKDNVTLTLCPCPFKVKACDPRYKRIHALAKKGLDVLGVTLTKLDSCG